MEKLSAIADNGYKLFCKMIENQELKTISFQPGEYLLRQGQDIHELYWVKMGEFTIEHTANNDRCYSLGLNFVENHLFGEIEYLTASSCQFDVYTCELIEVKVIPISLMTQILQLDPKIAIWLSRSMSKRYQTGMRNTMNRFLHPLIYNIAWDIYQRHIGTKDAVNFSQVYKEADRFGCSERVYRRVVNQLCDMKLVEKIDNRLKIKCTAKLAEFLGP